MVISESLVTKITLGMGEYPNISGIVLKSLTIHVYHFVEDVEVSVLEQGHTLKDIDVI